MPKIAVQNTLRTSPLFSGLTPEEKAEIAASCQISLCARGEMLFLRNENVSKFYVLCQGVVQLFRYSPNGREITAEVFVAGDLIGDTEILQLSAKHNYSARAVKSSTLMEFSPSWLRDMVKQNDTLALNLLGIISSRNTIASLEAEQKKTLSAAQQVACFLKRLCVLHNLNPREFKLPYSKSLIASRLNLELGSFSRALSTLRQHGLSIKGTSLSFVNLKELASFACGDCSLNEDCQHQEELCKQWMNGKSVCES